MKKTFISVIFMAVFLLSPLPVFADYLGDYVAPAKYKITVEQVGNEVNSVGLRRYRNRYAGYLDVVEKCIEQYGDTDICDGPCAGMQHFTGLSFLKLIDFNDDGIEELFLAFHVRTNDISEQYEEHVYIYNVWGYDGEKAVLLQDGNYLYGFDGGSQAVFFVKNPFGTFFLHGAADSFQYDYYYGYEGEKFGLAKTMQWEEEYDASGSMRRIYSVDGKNVSEDFFKSEAELWGRNSSEKEAYNLTFYKPDDRDRVRDLIDDTIRFLQQHCEELVITQEKGKTLLNVQFYQAQENPPVYSLVQRNNDSGEKKTIALVQPPSVNDPEEQEYTLAYDFSTDLHLESGIYQFFLYEQGTEEESEPVVAAGYVYDEDEKIDEDDKYGNEREYRRLLSMLPSPMSNNDFVSNITDRLSNFGFSSEHVKKIVTYLKKAPEPCRSIYLYSFYKYSYEQGRDILFATGSDNIRICEDNAITLVEFYTTFFHESGHAIDFNAGQEGYYTLTCDADAILSAMKKDLRNAVDAQVSEWMKDNPGLVLCTKEELIDKICDKLYSADTEITREDCHDFSGNEYKAYVYVEDKLRSLMADTLFAYKHGANGDMRDVFMGWTANKVAKKTVAGDSLEGHSVSYWWDNEGHPTGKLINESWAEFFAAMLVGDQEVIKSNETMFPATCEYYKSMAKVLLDSFKRCL